MRMIMIVVFVAGLCLSAAAGEGYVWRSDYYLYNGEPVGWVIWTGDLFTCKPWLKCFKKFDIKKVHYRDRRFMRRVKEFVDANRVRRIDEPMWKWDHPEPNLQIIHVVINVEYGKEARR